MIMKELLKTPTEIARELARKYSTMTHDELTVLESILVPMRFGKGDMILSEGEVCKNFYYIEKGLIRQYYLKNDKEVTEHLAPEGEVVMCIESLFKEQPTHLQIEALEPTIVHCLPKMRLEEISLHNVNIQILYRKILEESLINSQIHADLVRFESSKNRYMRMCHLSPQLSLRVPLVFIASYLQMTPETLSRVRSTALVDAD